MNLVVCDKCGSKNRVEVAAGMKRLAKCGKCGALLDINRIIEAPDPGKPFTVTDATFQREISQTTKGPILIDCWAPWCGPCRMVAPILDQLASESNGRYRIAKLNVDENPRTAEQYQIQSIPTMLIFRGGNLVDRIIGAQPKQVIAERLTRAA
jgi:thioredoxin